MNVDSATDSPQLTQIQKVNACLRCLIQVSLLFSMYRLWGGGGGFWSRKAGSCLAQSQEEMPREENLW